MPQDVKLFQPLRLMAIRVGVAPAWLKAEADAGRVPHLKIGRRLFFNPELVEQALLNLARQTAERTVAHA